ncbi:MAG: hypothetical protein WDO70_02585 [Alphaproteobacteria bacterium]
MDRVIAAIFLMLSIAQVQVLFVGAFEVSLHTNWNRIGVYAVRQVERIHEEITAPSKEEPAAPAKTRNSGTSGQFIDLSTRGDSGPRAR